LQHRDGGGPVYSYDPSGLSVTRRGTISLGQPGTARCAHARDRESSRFVLWAPLLRPAGDSTVGTLQFFGGAHML
jgi:hypothetical protein